MLRRWRSNSLPLGIQGGRGIAGQGWNLSGLSAISRCRQTLGQDGAPKAITFTDDDRLCLDGQRLVVVSGNYWSTESVYETEIDSFTQVTLKSGNSFEVARKDGSVSLYGGTADNDALGADGYTQMWLLTTFQDSVAANGGSTRNTINYHYEATAIDNTKIEGHRLKRITYSGGDGVVDFTYADESSYSKSATYSGGYMFITAPRLESITTSFNTDTIRHYKLGYDENLQTSIERLTSSIERLTSIEECVNTLATTCLQPTTFSWSDEVLGFETAVDKTVTLVPGDDDYLLDYRPADINGDGFMDLVWLELGISGNQVWPKIHTIVSRDDGANGYTLESSGNYSTIHLNPEEMDQNGNFTKYRMEFIDYNGDGRQDLLLGKKPHYNPYSSQPYVPASWEVRLATPVLDTHWKLGAVLDVTLPFSDFNIKFSDMNSDGLVDAVRASYNGILVWPLGRDSNAVENYSFGDLVSYSSSVVLPAPEPDSDFGTIADCASDSGNSYEYSQINIGGDYNGDGVTDYIKRSIRECTLQFDYDEETWTESRNHIMLAQPETETSTVYTLLSSAFDNVSAIKPIDINGDGLSDMLLAGKYYINTGTGFNEGVLLPSDIPVDYSEIDYDHSGNLSLIWFDKVANKIKRIAWDGLAFGSVEVLVTTTSGAPSQAELDYLEFLAECSESGNTNYECDEDYDASDFIVIDSTNRAQTHIFLDMNGDGVQDNVRVTPDSGDQKIEVHLGITPTTIGGDILPLNTIVAISNGMSNNTEINYGSLNRSGHYSTLQMGTTTATGVDCDYGDENEPEYNEPCTPYDYTFETANSAAFYSALYSEWDIPANPSPENGTAAVHTLGKYRPTIEVNGPMYVVTRVASSAPTAATNDDDMSGVSYYYGNAKAQASGRGFLGFEKLTTIDEQTGVQTTTYRQDFPFLGYPLKTEVYNKDEELLSRSTNYWQLKKWSTINGNLSNIDAGTMNLLGDNNGGFQPYIAKSIEESFSLNVDENGLETTSTTALQTVTTDSDYDSYGNATRIKVTTVGENAEATGNDTFIKEVVNDYGTSDYDQGMGRLKETVVSTSVNGDAAEPRTSAFTYAQSGVIKGLLKTETIEPYDAQYTVATTYLYDTEDGTGNYGNRVKATQESDGLTRFVATLYDTDGRFSDSSSNALGHTPSQVYARNKYGSPTVIENIDGVRAETTYDAFGRKVMSYSETGAWSYTLLSSDTAGCPVHAITIATTTSAGAEEDDLLTAKECLDALGRPLRKMTRTFAGGWSMVDVEYDELGRITRQSQPHSGTAQYWTEMFYDSLGRPRMVIAPDENGSTTSITSIDGFTTTTINASNLKKSETKNALGQLVKVTDNVDGAGNETHTIRYFYDIEGNLEFVKQDDGGHVFSGSQLTTSLKYDRLGRKTQMSDPDKGNWNYYYNGFGELELQVDGKNQSSVLAYDVLGRMISRQDYQAPASRPTNKTSAATGSLEGQTLWTYDTLNGEYLPGKLLKVEDTVSGYVQLYSYDYLGRAEGNSTQIPGQSVIYENAVTYDQFGRTFQSFDAAGNGQRSSHGVQSIYNSFGFLSEVIDAQFLSDGTSKRRFQAINQMDLRGNVTNYSMSNGVTVRQSYYAESGRLFGLNAQYAIAGTVQDLTYS